ncbi:hypothetical protein ACP70R_011663 [Stipagrostis hirtigluma subsp. patula]
MASRSARVLLTILVVVSIVFAADETNNGDSLAGRKGHHLSLGDGSDGNLGCKSDWRLSRGSPSKGKGGSTNSCSELSCYLVCRAEHKCGGRKGLFFPYCECHECK